MSKPTYTHGKFGEFPKFSTGKSVESILQYHADKTPENLQVAVLENVRLAAWFTYYVIDRKRLSYLTDDEIYSICCGALEKAIRRFNPQMGIAFSTFATRVMLNAITTENRQATAHAKHYDKSDMAADRINRQPDHRSCTYEEVDIDEAVRLVEEWVSKNLSKRMQIVYRERRDGATLQEIGKKIKVSKERVGQLHKRIVRQLKEEFKFLRGALN